MNPGGLPLGLSRAKAVNVDDLTPAERAEHDEYWLYYDWGYDPSDNAEEPQDE